MVDPHGNLGLHHAYSHDRDTRGTKLKVENLHYELTEDDLDVRPVLQYSMKHVLTMCQGLFTKIGPVLKLELLYDRAGRSEGVAFVTYDHRDDALEAIREFNGANAKGMFGFPDI